MDTDSGFVVRVDTPTKGIITFSCIIHQSSGPGSRMIEPEFYQRYHPEGGPTGIHIEMEMTDLSWRPEGLPIHIHKNPVTKKDFVCWAMTVDSIERAKKVFALWALGTAFTLVHGQDFVPVYQRAPRHFVEWLETECKIRIVR